MTTRFLMGVAEAGTAWQISIGNLAGTVTPIAFPASDKLSYHRGYSLVLSGLCLAGAAALAYLVGCLRENKRGQEDGSASSLIQRASTLRLSWHFTLLSSLIWVGVKSVEIT